MTRFGQRSGIDCQKEIGIHVHEIGIQERMAPIKAIDAAATRKNKPYYSPSDFVSLSRSASKQIAKVKAKKVTPTRDTNGKSS